MSSMRMVMIGTIEHEERHHQVVHPELVLRKHEIACEIINFQQRLHE